MAIFELMVALLLGAVVLAAVACRVGAPDPTFLALGGALLGFVPRGPELVLEPDLALTLFIAPVLLDAAYDTSLRDLKDHWVPVRLTTNVSATSRTENEPARTAASASR